MLWREPHYKKQSVNDRTLPRYGALTIENKSQFCSEQVLVKILVASDVLFSEYQLSLLYSWCRARSAKGDALAGSLSTPGSRIVSLDV